MSEGNLTADRPSLVGISGSLRSASYSTAILRSAAEAIADRADLAILPIDALPLYNQDLEADLPPAVTAFRDAVGEAAGIVMVTPEYNYSISGVLKNALDWASRPYGQSKLTGKPVYIVSNSPAFTGGVRAQSHLNDVLIANACRLLPRPQTVVGLVQAKVENGRLVDAASLAFIEEGLAHLLQTVADVADGR